MACNECSRVAMPPNTILFLPPPPVPNFLHPPKADHNFTAAPTANCIRHLCKEAWLWQSLLARGDITHETIARSQKVFLMDDNVEDRFSLNAPVLSWPDTDEYMEVAAKDWGNALNVDNKLTTATETSSNVTASEMEIGDAWLIILIGSTVGILMLSFVLALFLLRCREPFRSLMNRSHSGATSRSKSFHGGFGGEAATLHTSKANPGQIILYPSQSGVAGGGVTTRLTDDNNRLLWATLTPSGVTKHFVIDTYTPDCVDYVPDTQRRQSIDSGGEYYLPRNDYEIIENIDYQQFEPDVQPTPERRHLDREFEPNRKHRHHSKHNKDSKPSTHSIPEPEVLVHSINKTGSMASTCRSYDFRYEDAAYVMNMTNTLHHQPSSSDGQNVSVDFHSQHRSTFKRKKRHSKHGNLGGSDCNPSSLTLNLRSEERAGSCSNQSSHDTLNRLISSPTRIEHPNLPPLNLHPNPLNSSNTLRMNSNCNSSPLRRRASRVAN